MNCSISLLTEIKPGYLTAIAYNSPSENSIWFNKEIKYSICNEIINHPQILLVDNLLESDKRNCFEAQAGLKCFYGTPVLNEKGELFGILSLYSKELPVIEEKKINFLEKFRSQIEDDILFASREKLTNNLRRNYDAQLEYFLQHSPLGIIYYDINLTITDLNDKFAEILKINREVLLGLDMSQLEDKRILPTLQSALLGAEDEYEGEYVTSTGGVKLNILLRTAPVYSDNKITGAIGIIQDISLRTNIAKALKSSEIKYRELVEKINDVIFSIDPNGICTYVSPVIKLLIGFSPEEIIGYQFIDFINDKHKVTFQDALEQVSLGTTVVSEVKIRDKNGAYRWIRNSMRPVYSEEGTFSNVHGIAQDIEEARSAEISLRESEEQFRMVATHTSDIIFEWNTNTEDLIWYGNPTIISKNLSHISKFSELIDIVHHDDKKKITQLWNNALVHHKPWKEEFKLLPPGSKVPIYILGSGIVLFKDKKSYKGFGTLTNISNEKRLVENLKLSNERLEENITKTNSLLSAIPDMMFVFDKSGYITDFHSNDDNQLFKTAPSFLNQNVLDVLPKNIAYLTLEKISLVLSSKKIETYKYQLNLKNDSNLQTFESRMAFLNQTHTLAIVRNITTNEQAQKELITAKERAEESDRLKSSFLANMSHEIRTPMNGIIGFSELLSSKTLNPEEREYYTSVIVKSGHQLLEIINDVLEISKIETGQIEVNNSIINVNDVLHTLFSLFNKRALEKNNHLKVYTILPDEEVTIVTDGGKLRQILNNLVSNAIKFTTNGKVNVGYSIVNNNFLEIYVEDNGIGIAKTEQNKIFERFSQANSRIMRQHGGTGLGLSISQSLVELLGGKIWVESKLEEGSKFTFTIPYKKANLPSMSKN